MNSRLHVARAAVALVCAVGHDGGLVRRVSGAREASWVARDFKVHTGEVMRELTLNYRTIGLPSGEPVLVLHGTAGSARSLLTPAFAGELFGPGQPLDAARYYIIIPDTLGHGKSSKPSDGLRTKFPKYNYDDMVDAHYRLLTEHLNVRHVRAIIGNSMGGMETWIFATRYPDYMDSRRADGLLPHRDVEPQLDAAKAHHRFHPQRSRLEGRELHAAAEKRARGLGVLRNRHQRRQPGALQGGADAREGGPAARRAMAAPFTADANDVLYQWDSSRDYNPSAGLEKIKAAVLAINAADDERNPPELGVLEREMKRVKNGRILLIPASENTAGHGTTGSAKFYQRELAEILQAAPRLSP
jgi:homoserine O-acetyltransferase